MCYPENCIHVLAVPACMISYSGEITDINEWMVRDLGASSKSEFVNCCITRFLIDHSKLDLILHELQSNGIVRNTKILFKTTAGKAIERTTNVTFFSKDNGSILFQNYGSFEHQYAQMPYTDECVLKYAKQLKPYLNTEGLDLLNQFLRVNNEIQIERHQNAKLEFFRKRLVETLPGLTKTESYLCTFWLLGFTSSEITYINGITLNNIRVTIFRLCRKFNVTSRGELFTFIKSKVGIDSMPNLKQSFY